MNRSGLILAVLAASFAAYLVALPALLPKPTEAQVKAVHVDQIHAAISRLDNDYRAMWSARNAPVTDSDCENAESLYLSRRANLLALLAQTRTRPNLDEREQK